MVKALLREKYMSIVDARFKNTSTQLTEYVVKERYIHVRCKSLPEIFVKKRCEAKQAIPPLSMDSKLKNFSAWS